jgi:predicted RNA-binding protein with PUA-like domain
LEHEDEVFDSSGFYSIPVACQNHSDVDEVLFDLSRDFDSPVRLKSIRKQNKKRKRGKKSRNRRNRRIKSE